MTPIILHELTKRFGSTTAVDAVTLEIPAGSLFFLLGPSGCGKTTLLRMIAGFAEPTSGAIRFGDRDVTTLPANARNAGMVFQGYALWPHMSVWENVAFGLDVRQVAAAQKKQRVQKALERVQMAELATRKPNQLSGGQQQRVALARALVFEPTVLLLDEPLSNLDAKLRLEMRTQIRDICRQAKITAVYVTHDQKEALSMADQIAVMQQGKLLQVGRPDELYRRPRTRFIADFLGETNFVPATVRGRDGDHLVLECAAGPVRSSVFEGAMQPGQAVTLSIRPEAMRMVAAPADRENTEKASENRWTLQWRDAIYLGEAAQHLLSAGDELSLKVLEFNPSPITAQLSEVRIGFDACDVVVLQS